MHICREKACKSLLAYVHLMTNSVGLCESSLTKELCCVTPLWHLQSPHTPAPAGQSGLTCTLLLLASSPLPLFWPPHQLHLHKQQRFQLSGRPVVKGLALSLPVQVCQGCTVLPHPASHNGPGQRPTVPPLCVFTNTDHRNPPDWAKKLRGRGDGQARAARFPRLQHQITLGCFQNNKMCACSPVPCCCHLHSGLVYNFVTCEEMACDHSVMRDAEPLHWLWWAKSLSIILESSCTERSKLFRQFNMTETLHPVPSLWHWTRSPFSRQAQG